MMRTTWILLLATWPAFAAPPGVGEELDEAAYRGHNAALAAMAKPGQTPAELLKGWVPEYPSRLMAQGRAGRCVLEYTISIKGRAVDVVLARQDDKQLCKAAVESLARWEFLPASENGRPVPIRLRMPIDFDLDSPQVDGSLFRAEARDDGMPFDLHIEEIASDGEATLLRVPGVHARSAEQARWLMCKYADLAVQRGVHGWSLRYPDPDQDLVALEPVSVDAAVTEAAQGVATGVLPVEVATLAPFCASWLGSGG